MHMALGKMVACPYEYLVYHMEILPFASLAIPSGAPCAGVYGSALFSESGYEGGCDGKTAGDNLRLSYDYSNQRIDKNG